MIYLRAADRYDALSLAELRAASLAELDVLAPAEYSAFVAAATRALYVLFGDERALAWLACDAERVVGSSCAILYDRLPYPEGSRHAEVCGVYVAPAYRNRGLASELVSEVVAEARAAGARKLFLRPSKLAKSLYARLGFVDTDLMAYEPATRTAEQSQPAASDAKPSEPVLAAWPVRFAGISSSYEYRDNPR